MRLGIDIGTSYTSACILTPTGTAQPIDIATGECEMGSKYSMPTAVFAADDGRLLVGQLAVNSRRRNPSHYRAEFKRNLGESIPIILGDSQYTVCQLYTELLAHIVECVKRVSNEQIDDLVLTYPACYEQLRKDILIEAAKNAGLFNVSLVDEPTAAALFYKEQGYIHEGETLLVYDYGGGTFDASIITLQNGSFRQVTLPIGLERCGGMDMDAKLEDDIIQLLQEKADLSGVKSKPDRMMRLQLMISNAAVKAKHSLSNTDRFEELFEIGLDDVEYSIEKEAFNAMIASMVSETIKVCRSIISNASLEMSDLSSILMVGGTSRVPLVQDMLRQLAGDVPVLMAPDLEMVVAQGALFCRISEDSDNTCTETNNARDDNNHVAAGDDNSSGNQTGETKSTESATPNPEDMYLLAKQFEFSGKYEEAVKWFQLAAQMGHIEAQYSLADCFDRGIGIEKNDEDAFFWFEKAANNGNTEAQAKFGTYYFNGIVVSRNFEEAVKWYKQAADKGHCGAQSNLGICNEYGYGIKKNAVEAVRLYHNAAMQGAVSAQYNLGRCYNAGIGIAKDDTEAVKWFRLAAEQGYSFAQYALGYSYYYGQGVAQNYNEAYNWYCKAAGQGNYLAENKLGLCFLNGFGVERSNDTAFMWFSASADQGYREAQYNLGWCYANGIGVTKNDTEAIKWYRSAAEQGLAQAQYELGRCYYGNRIYRNEAADWFRKAAEQEHASAQYMLGLCCINGFGVRRNNEEAVKWWRKAAEQGVPNAQYDLAGCYYRGQGVVRNRAEAKKWYLKAAERGYLDADRMAARCR